MTTKRERRKESAHENEAALEPSPIIPTSEALEAPPPVVLPHARKGGRAKDSSVLPDAVASYFRDIRQYPKLSREEEFELAKRYFETADLDAAYRLICSNLWLVVKISREYERAAKNMMDLVQEGNIGLMEAVKNFDPFRNVRFPSYAVWWIKAYIVRYVIANWRMVKIGTTQAQRKLFFNLHKEKRRLEREGFVPTTKLLAQNLDVKESEVIEMEQRLGGGDVSLDSPFTENEGGSNLLSVLPADGETVEDVFQQIQRTKLLQESMEAFRTSLRPRERIIFDRRMISEDRDTLQDLSEALELSRERIRQIESRIKSKLKAFLEQRFMDDLHDVIDV